MFETKNGRIIVFETMNGFYIRDTKTNATSGMGDGVDMFTDENGASIMVGTPKFYRELRRMVRNEKAMLLEAYFGIVD